MADIELLKEAKEAFQDCESAESHNRETAIDDIKFALLDEQWDARDAEQRQREGRPCLTINKLDPIIRQVVNDARQNKPSIKVHPADSDADPETAEIYNGLIRNIEYTSNADVAYDTATEQAIAGGFGYFRVGIDYAFHDGFDLDIRIDRIANQFAVYGDPNSTAADSSDWNIAFVVDRLSKDEFERRYKGNEAVDWSSGSYGANGAVDGTWFEADSVLIAEYWTREEYDKDIVQLSDGTVLDAETLKNDFVGEMAAAEGLTVVKTRKARCKRVKQHILTGADVISTTEWPGQYIPIVPVYGREVNVQGKRYFRSLIHSAKDAQRIFNYWRSASTELVALSPKAPFIGPKGAFDYDIDKWSTANRTSHAYIEYEGNVAPIRQPFSGPPAAALQEALNASDDIKAATGIYDASLGARSNETSGRAILARQREGDVSTFHFQDNMTRAIRHAGRILIDLIPKIYTKERIVRVLGEDKTAKIQQLGKPVPVTDKAGQPKPVLGPDGQPQMRPDGTPEIMTRVYDLSLGKYDLTVTTGPSYTTQREEAAVQMTEMIRAAPATAPVVLPRLAKNSDWPEADDIAEELAALAPKPDGGLPPQVAQALQQLQQQNAQMSAELQAAKLDKQTDLMKAETDRFNAETERMKVQAEIAGKAIELSRPQPQPAPQRQ